MRAIGHRYYEGVALNNLSLALYNALGEHGAAHRNHPGKPWRFFDRLVTNTGRLSLSSTSAPLQEHRQLALSAGMRSTRYCRSRASLTSPYDEARILSSLAELLTNMRL